MTLLGMDTVQLTFWTVGFLTTLYTGTAAWAYALVALAWFTVIHPALYRESPDSVQVDFHYWWVFSTTAGVVTAAVALWSFRLPRLVKTELVPRTLPKVEDKEKEFGKRRYLSLDFSLFVVWAGLLLAGYYCVHGDFSDGVSTWPYARALTTGVGLIVAGAVCAVLHFAWLFANKANRRESALNGKYIIALAIGLASVPIAYDFAFGHGPNYGYGLIALAVIIGYWVLAGVWSVYFIWNGKAMAVVGHREWKGKQDRFKSRFHLIAFFVCGGVAQFLLYLVAWLVDLYYAPTNAALPVVVAIGATSALECLLFILIGAASYSTLIQAKKKAT
jgi:hypothetical protein